MWYFYLGWVVGSIGTSSDGRIGPTEKGKELVWCPQISRSEVGEMAFILDLPGFADATGTTTLPMERAWIRPKAAIHVEYNPQKTILDCAFTVWAVLVVNNASANEAHYVPYKKQSWELKMDSTDATKNSWKTNVTGEPSAPTKPTDKTTSGIGVNSGFLFSAMKTVTK